MSKLVIYHGCCPDGFSSAHIINEHFADEDIEFFPGVYQQDPPDVTDKDVIMVDFSYKRPIMEMIKNNAKSFTWIDHHISAIEECSSLDLDGLRDVNHSGCILTWKYFSKTPNKIPFLYCYVEDRDLWQHKLAHSKVISQYILSKEYNFNVWTDLKNEMETNLDIATMKGQSILTKYEKDISELITQTKCHMNIGGYYIPVCNLPYIYASDAAARIAEDHTFGACYYIKSNKNVYVSLRSKDSGLDVSKIARLYGGGGHVHAAGFELSLSIFMRMFQENTNG
jgi:oligoribonuclease NrnB/cAMP/cGMP phosphodiesterase (DHH superfamily)